MDLAIRNGNRESPFIVVSEAVEFPLKYRCIPDKDIDAYNLDERRVCYFLADADVGLMFASDRIVIDQEITLPGISLIMRAMNDWGEFNGKKICLLRKS